MAFSIAFPDNNRSITRQIIAWGTKDPAAPRPTGVLISTRPNGSPDGKCVVGGVTIRVKRKGNSGALTENNSRWAIHFRVVGAQTGDRFTLLILDPEQLVAANPSNCQLAKKTGITLRVSQFSTYQRESPNTRGQFVPYPYSAVYPAPTDTVPRDNFVAYGMLPTGDYDIDTDPASTYVDKDGTRTAVDWSWTDGGGFWAAFFPPINGAVAGDRVTFHVEYKDSGEPENVSGILLS